MRALAVAVLLSSLLAPAAFAATLELQAEAHPATTLPGLPIAVRVQVTNTGRTVALLPRHYIVEVVASNGRPYLSTGDSTAQYISSVPEVYGPSPEALPGTSLVLDIPLGASGAYPGYLADPRLMEPGTYRLRLIFDEKLKSNSDPVVVHGHYDRSIRPYLETNEIILTVETPEGQDAAFLARLRSDYGVSSLSSLSPRKRAQAASHWAEFPRSRYSPHLALMLRTSNKEEQVNQILRVLEMNPESMLADRLRVSLVDIEKQRALQAEFDGDASAATEHEKKARVLAEAAVKQAETPLGRLQAENARRRIFTPQRD